MGEDGAVSLRDSYWFAFISTTTIGFGDFYLSPDVLLPEDIVWWPLSFLLGFVFCAAFIGKVGEALANPLQRKGIRLAERLKLGRPMDDTLPNDSNVEHELTDKEPRNVGESREDVKSFDAMQKNNDGRSKHDPEKMSDNGMSVDTDRLRAVIDSEQHPDKLWLDREFTASSVDAGSPDLFSVKMESLIKGYVD